MSTLPLYGSPSKADIIQMAREECATAGFDFEATAEEDASALRRLQSMLAEWEDNQGIALGYNFAANGYGSVEDDSGIPRGALEAVSCYLALRLAPNMGKMLSSESKQAMTRSMSALRAAYQAIPPMQLARNTIRGAGSNRRWSFGTPFFVTTVPDDEIPQ